MMPFSSYGSALSVSLPTIAILGTASTLSISLAYLIYTNKLPLKLLPKRISSSSSKPSLPLPPPTTILDLRVYPIKSCRGFSVRRAAILPTGLDLDRNWMFVSMSDREFITIRNNPRMTLLDTRYDEGRDELDISIHGGRGGEGDGEGTGKGKGKGDEKGYVMSIPAHPTAEWLEANTTLVKTSIWGQETDGWEYPESWTRPFAEFLGQEDRDNDKKTTDVRLVFKGPTTRPLRGSGSREYLGRDASTKFADMLPVQVSSMASMRELNGRLREKGESEITIERFRPNIVVKSHEPWTEDSWKTVRITDPSSPSSLSSNQDLGKAKSDAATRVVMDMDVACRCLRCQVPNVEPETGVKNPREPWDTLMKYRRIDRGMRFKPGFGMLCVPRLHGEGPEGAGGVTKTVELEVGMGFEVTEMTDQHFFVSPMK